mgnify:FL=1
MADPRLGEAIAQFNAAEWYACHDGFEALWHETAGPMRVVLQGILQIAVAQLHRERGNLRGATVLLGEGLGRLRQADPIALGLDIKALRTVAAEHLNHLQALEPANGCNRPEAGITEPSLPAFQLRQPAWA